MQQTWHRGVAVKFSAAHVDYQTSAVAPTNYRRRLGGRTALLKRLLSYSSSLSSLTLLLLRLLFSSSSPPFSFSSSSPPLFHPFPSPSSSPPSRLFLLLPLISSPQTPFSIRTNLASLNTIP